MKIGLSTYSLYHAIAGGEMDVLGAIEWIANNGGEHVEIVPIGYEVDGKPELIEAIKQKAKSVGIEISQYTVGANFLQPTEEAYSQEVNRLKQQVEVARDLGVRFMRHDVAIRPPLDATIQNFEKDLPRCVEACRQIADYAAQFGITTSVENHGYHIQHADRVQRLVSSVDRPNYRTTVDVGNFLCADEDPVVAVRKNMPFASFVHLKDFYRRCASCNPGEGWFPSAGGYLLRGAIFGQGDMNTQGIMQVIRDSGYDGYLSIEFEGLEECKLGSRISLQNAKRLWSEVV